MKTNISILLLVVLLTLSSCELFDKHEKPNIKFKTGTGYTVADATVAKGATVKVGIIADKTEDSMKTYNISYAYDGATTTSTKETFSLSSSEETHYEKDFEFTVRNQAGKEQWSFTITDRDGNIAQLSITLTVN
jgi:hypothetical protein